MEQKIYQYTSIDTLALILQSKKILFNRLDHVDDLEENIKSLGINLGKYVFVSCWTESKEENIPLWNIYTDKGVGVRIGMNKEMFQDYYITDGMVQDVHVDGVLKSKIPAQELVGSNYFVIPSFDQSSQNFFYRKIEYVDNVYEITKGVTIINNGTLNINFGKIALYKQKRWDFQNESRYVLTIIPRSPEIKLSDPQLANWVLKALMENKDLPFTSFFLNLSDNALDTMEIRLSPNISPAKKLIVEALRDKYAPNAVIEDSRLNGLVKFK